MTRSEMAKVRLEERGAVRVVTLDDPDRRNAIGADMRDALLAAFAAVRDDPTAGVLVVTGSGPSFCAGADLPAVFGEPDRPVAEIRADLQELYASFLVLRTLRIPTIAAVSGHAVGAGLNLALACDIRVTTPTARFGATFARIGLHPGGGCTAFLVEALGRERALALLLDGGALSGEDAVAAGLALRCVDEPLTEALALAERYAALDPALVRDVKSTVGVAATAGFDATVELESWAQASSATRPAVRAHVARFAR